MTRFSLNFKLISSISLICLLLSSLSGFVLYNNYLDSRSYRSIATNSLPKVKELGELLAVFRQIRIEVRSLGIQGNTSADYENFAENAKAQVAEFQRNFDQLKPLLKDEQERKRYNELKTAWEEFLRFGQRMLKLAQKRDPASLDRMQTDIRIVCPVKAAKFIEPLKEFIKAEEKQAEASVARTVASAERTFSITVVLLAVFSFGAIVFGVVFSRRISGSIKKAFTDLLESSNKIESRSSFMDKSASSLSGAVQKQSSSLQQTAASVDEISAMVSKNAANAQNSADKAKSTSGLVEDGKKKVDDMRHSIQEISESNDGILEEIRTSNEEIEGISNIIQDISEKTGVINDIVFQTKLLSFNASVEAARAGEHGKGFAVVAEEVGNLAAMSGKAADEINDMLESSIGKVKEVVQKSKDMMERVSRESSEKVGKGVNLAEQSKQALDEILEGVRYVNDLVGEIANASSEQAEGIKEINSAVYELDQVTKENSSIAGESERSAKDLKEEVESLKRAAQGLAALVDGGSGSDLEEASVGAAKRPQRAEHKAVSKRSVVEEEKKVAPSKRLGGRPQEKKEKASPALEDDDMWEDLSA